MPKTILLAITVLFISSQSIAQRFIFDDSLNEAGVFPVSAEVIKKNGIKKAIEVRYSNNKCTDTFFTIKNLFDTSGNLIWQSRDWKKGNIATTDTFIYDNQNRIIEQYFDRYKDKYMDKCLYYYKGESLANTIFNMFYSEFDQHKEDILFIGHGTTEYATSYFNNKHQLTEHIFYDSTHKVEREVKYTYEEHGLPLTETSYDKKGYQSYENIFEYKFSKKGRRMIVWQGLNTGNKELQESKFNNLGQCIWTDFQPAFHRAFNEYKFNDDGTLFQCITYLLPAKWYYRFYYFK